MKERYNRSKRRMEETTTPKTHVRYAVHYNDRNYEYALHSEKRHFVRNLADVVNILEYCIVQDLKKNQYKIDGSMYNYDVIRLVNDQPDENFHKEWFKGALSIMVKQLIDDNIQRNN